MPPKEAELLEESSLFAHADCWEKNQFYEKRFEMGDGI